MELKDVGEVIANRTYYLLGDDGSKREVIVKLGMPRPFSDGQDCYCPYQVVGLGPERVYYAAGVDAFQALQLVMRMIGARLHSLNEEHGGGLRWLNDNEMELGFPSD